MVIGKLVRLMRSAYRYAAALALINLAAIALGFIGVAATGSLDAERLRRAVDVLRGLEPATRGEPAASVPDPREAARLGDADGGAVLAAEEAQTDLEILHREAERIKVELDQRLALNNSIMLKVRGERQQFAAEREAAAKRDEQARQSIRDEGFEKQVAIFEALSPKVAVQHLLGMNDPVAAARILMAIDADRARKIVEAAKRGPELTQMQVILQRVREAAPPAAPGLTMNDR